MILVANKLDLQDESRIVSFEEGDEVAKKNNILFFEGSGCTGENVEKIFTAIAEKVYTNLIEEDSGNGSSLILKKKKHKKEKRECC